jgi:hypothetical protein
MPYYRQIKQYNHLGMKGLTESTVDGWFKQTIELLKPLYEVLKVEVMKFDYLSLGQTPAIGFKGRCKVKCIGFL